MNYSSSTSSSSTSSASSIMEIWTPSTQQIREAIACCSCGVIPMLPFYTCEAQGHPYCFWCAKRLSFSCTKIADNEAENAEARPCGSAVHTHRCKLVEAIFLKSLFMCNNAAKGCTAVVAGQEFVAHQDICLFRTYECPFQLKCSDPIPRDQFIPHFLDIHEIPMITVNSSELMQHNITCPTRSINEDTVVWVERIVRIRHINKIFYVFMNCKYEFDEKKLVIWVSDFDDIRDMKIYLNLKFFNSTGIVLKKMNGGSFPYFCKLGGLLKDNQTFCIRDALELVGGRDQNNMNFWAVAIKFYFHPVPYNLVPGPLEVLT